MGGEDGWKEFECSNVVQLLPANHDANTMVHDRETVHSEGGSLAKGSNSKIAHFCCVCCRNIMQRPLGIIGLYTDYIHFLTCRTLKMYAQKSIINNELNYNFLSDPFRCA